MDQFEPNQDPPSFLSIGLDRGFKPVNWFPFSYLPASRCETITLQFKPDWQQLCLPTPLHFNHTATSPSLPVSQSPRPHAVHLSHFIHSNELLPQYALIYTSSCSDSSCLTPAMIFIASQSADTGFRAPRLSGGAVLPGVLCERAQDAGVSSGRRGTPGTRGGLTHTGLSETFDEPAPSTRVENTC
ncbi:unnamed protein product [Pleuronectes platessa]|uniref:Uncharacterized protein n=1 Tax=Pleuronectes platessa TaxID=8262 RepID=A0A9N7ULR8_PLEPL|nr:unnamed protein product [Pleuronectes platessa]